MKKRKIIKSLTILVLLLSLNNIHFAQVNEDSSRVVAEALKMINFPDPTFKEPYVSNPTPKEISDMGFEQQYQSEVTKFRMRDDSEIHAQKFEHSSNSTIVLIHGTLASSYTYNKMAGLLREAVGATVIAIDLRGHGQSHGAPGDVSNSDQYVEDLFDIISSIKSHEPVQKIILAGHSMGGGIVLKYIETYSQSKVDGILLFAPNLGNNSPTTSQNLNLENNFIKIHLSRGLGLKMLNEFGIHQYDSLKVVFYNLPEQMPLRSYSFRSMEASFPEDYKQALRLVKQPMLVLVGSKDEAFIAEEYPHVIRAYSKGMCYVIKDETHNGIRHNNEAMKKVESWAIENKLK